MLFVAVNKETFSKIAFYLDFLGHLLLESKPLTKGRLTTKKNIQISSVIDY